MLTEFTIEMQFIICTFTVWRLTHLFVSEDGPWDFVFLLRKRLGDTVPGRAMDCFYCLSVWMSIPFAFMVSHWVTRFICWISLSGAACLLEQFSGIRNHPDENNKSNKKKQS